MGPRRRSIVSRIVKRENIIFLGEGRGMGLVGSVGTGGCVFFEMIYVYMRGNEEGGNE